eukprot:8569237-Alexandrium_andersonii.AAC.1
MCSAARRSRRSRAALHRWCELRCCDSREGCVWVAAESQPAQSTLGGAPRGPPRRPGGTRS